MSPAFIASCERAFGDCRRILHAGDFLRGAVLEALAARWQLEAVRGNMDYSAELARLPRVRRVLVGGLEVGLCHGDGGPRGNADVLIGRFGQQPPPVIICGHTHVPRDQVVHGIRILNPGSAGDRRGEPACTVGRLTVSGDRVDFEIIGL